MMNGGSRQAMLNNSEIIVTITIWALTAIGCFFALRAIIRNRRNRK